MKEHKHVFTSEGLACEGSLYLPETENPPVVVLGQGFGAERSMGTGGFVRAFVNAGYAVFSFDYRGFGASAGKPRQLVNASHHCQDWYNAVQYVRSLQTIDNQQVFLWGSSFAGGHVLVTASRIHGLAGIIAQVPFCSSRSLGKSVGLGKIFASLAHALLDSLLSLVGLEHRVALLARPGKGFAMMDWPGWHEDYMKIAETSTTWENSMPARGIIANANYNPIDSVHLIDCPVLIISGSKDQGIPRADVLATVEKTPHCRHVELDFDHFDLYEGFDLHEQAVSLQVAFLRETSKLRDTSQKQSAP
jgi:pimeloyl-ACP methyl ester carboxylesterase